jgi:phage terminase Nu1 subunit (DNA packaging protein)
MDIDALTSLIADHAAQIATLTAERDAARKALKGMVYEVTHLSAENDDGSHNCRISRDALTNARAELKEQSNG